MSKQLSKVEIDGWEALAYDSIMKLISGFSYDRFIGKVVDDLNIKPNDAVLDLGCGTAKNLCLIAKYTTALCVGFDTSRNMIRQAKKRCKDRNVKIFYQDIRKPHPFYDMFDVVFISFVLHGFIDRERDLIIKNAYNSLKKGGRFCVLDYNEFDLKSQNPFVKAVFKYGECPLASEFIGLNLKDKLSLFGFDNFEEHYYYSGYVRLLIGEK
ncbi:class I SAM-dependent methyltransferase [Hippea maritima]|uniref:Methyltransferase type 11 n=1 Tax=Hippea maritima (strain ATCC 700847 / DSM 10411 / MH2) TaxID=760142 RepID=F2LVN8_HIPMA|nr:class I SAM-dependent methyltransferase [Hippea maritima]AEA33822.1 Methyltransferase type 11 [Hippea maritima DSM 10411]